MSNSKKFQVEKRDYLKISLILGGICLGGLAYSLFLYDFLIDKAIKWVIFIIRLKFVSFSV